MRATRTRLPTAWLLLGMCGLALAIRLACLDCYGLWYDEVASIEIARRGPLAIFTDRFGGMLVQTPLHYFLVWLTIQPLDPAISPVLVRLPSVLAGALAPLAVYALGRELFGRAQGLLAALLITLSAIQIGHSQDVRPYTFLVLFTALSVYCLLVAQRTGQARWWFLFALSTIAALHMSYFTLTLFLPALAPYLLWLLIQRSKVQSPKSNESDIWISKIPNSKFQIPNSFGIPHSAFRPMLLSFLAIALAALPLVWDILQLQRAAPDWSRLPPILTGQFALFFSRQAQLGIGGAFEQYIQWALFILAVWGAVSALLNRRFSAVALCALLLIVPSVELAAFRTTNMVFQRYALFAMPFYFSLIANGLVSLWPRSFFAPSLRSALRALAALVATGVFLLFLYSLYIYFSPDQHRRLSSLPDYRGAAVYLARQAGPRDLIILGDEPALGMAVVNFYWRGRPPAPTFDARDPRLFSQRVEGSIYWVVSFFQNEPDYVQELARADPAWTDAQAFERLAVFRERDPRDITASMERFVARLEAKSLDFQPVRTLRGGLHQARGDIAKAAQSYRTAGPYYPQLGQEFFASATGFDRRGNEAMAWREALTSKFMLPGNPDLHRWLSQRLQQAGYPAESQAEAQIADALARK